MMPAPPTIGVIVMIIAPCAFWALYHRYKDRHQPEPAGFLLLSYFLGVLGGYLGTYAYESLDWFGLRYDPFELARDDLTGLFLYAVFGIGLIEELVKFVPFWLIAIRHHHFDEPVDGIIYAAFAALGFASYENLHYLPWMAGWEALGRAIASPMVHVMFASIWGYACSRAQMAGRPLWPSAAVGLAIAALVHGLYDFMTIGFPDWVGIGAPMIIALVWGWRMFLIRRLHREHLGSE